MSTQQVAIRLKSEGGSEVKRDFRDVGQAGEAAGLAAARGAQQATDALDRQERKLRLLASAARDAAAANQNQARFNAALGVRDAANGSARQSADFFEEVFREQEMLQAKASSLKAVLDPVAAAQNRLNLELAEYRTLAKAGAISTSELAAAEALAKKRFDETAASLNKRNGATRLETSSRLNLARQGADVLVTGAMGMNPAMIAIQQGPQILDAWATAGLKASASTIALTAAVGATTAAAVLMAAAYLKAEDAQLRLERAASGAAAATGMSAGALESAAADAARAGELSRGAARDMAIEFASTGRIGGDVLTDLIALTKAYAAATGQDAKDATKELGASFADPIAGAETLNAKLNFLSAAEQQHIQNLARAGDEAGAQRIMIDALARATDGAAASTAGWARTWNDLKVNVANAVDQLGRALFSNDIERLTELRTQRAIQAAVPFGLGNEAVAKIDKEIADLQARAIAGWDRQRDAIRNQQSRDRQMVIDRYLPDAGKLQKLEADAARLAKLGAGDKDAVEVLAKVNKEIGAMRAGYSSAAEQAAALKRQQRDGDKAARDAAREARKDEREREEAARKAKALQDAVLDGRVKIAQLSENKADIDFFERQQRGYALTAQYAQTALSADEQRMRVVAQLAQEAAAEAGARAKTLSNPDGFVSSADRMKSVLKDFDGQSAASVAALDRIKAAGEGAFDRLGDLAARGADSWGEWKDAGLSALNDIREEIFRLVALNPLKNLLFGTSLPTSADAGGLFGKAFKGIGSLFGRNAEGTNSWRGGATWVGEEGPELVNLPAGSRVFSSPRSMAIASDGVSAPVSISIDARGADSAGLARVEAQLASLERTLPGRIVSTVRDAQQRRIIRP